MSDRDPTEMLVTVEVSATGSESADAPSREQLVVDLFADREAGAELVLAGVLAKGLGIAQIGRITMMGGSCNTCPVPRLIRVRLDGGDESRLAEPTPCAVIEAGLSLLRAKGAE